MFGFGNKKREEALRSQYRREDQMFDAIMNTTESMIQSMRNEILDVVFSVAMASGVTTKKIAENYRMEKLLAYTEDLLEKINDQIEKNSDVKNVYDKPKAKAVKKVAKKK